MKRLIIAVLITAVLLLLVSIAAEKIWVLAVLLPQTPAAAAAAGVGLLFGVLILLTIWGQRDATPLGGKPKPPEGGWRK